MEKSHHATKLLLHYYDIALNRNALLSNPN